MVETKIRDCCSPKLESNVHVYDFTMSALIDEKAEVIIEGFIVIFMSVRVQQDLFLAHPSIFRETTWSYSTRICQKI